MANSFRPLYHFAPEELRPTIAEWLRHGFWFFITLLTTTTAGLLPPLGSGVALPDVPFPTTALEWLFIVPHFYIVLYASIIGQIAVNPLLLVNGLMFSVPLLAILTAHEFGHYIAARIYGVKTTLPFFIPMPAFIGPAGTLGAVIKIKSPLPTQRATFDVGIAGPLAGFAVILPVMLLGLTTMQYAPEGAPAEMVFADPLLARLLGMLVGVDPARGLVNPFYSAAWIGTLVTSLNLLPVGQLDGGHATYAVLGEQAHYWIGRIAFVVMVALTILGYQLYGTPSTLIFTILLAVLLRIPHPEPLVNQSLDGKRKLLAVVTLAVFVLSFMPFPVQMP